ncbi:hypothetical protein T12_2339 [Trichinella patagoniensis]|uniref:Uncharacterized protein n=1 Tax=Trichinella patagoniensis TaxID=990121 RepID=A0A0V0ZZ25_9BILA|nr:hypothetical protein T12_2339 [Trichinella patagoniensis]
MRPVIRMWNCQRIFASEVHVRCLQPMDLGVLRQFKCKYCSHSNLPEKKKKNSPTSSDKRQLRTRFSIASNKRQLRTWFSTASKT